MAMIYEKRQHVALLQINRPEALNAIDPDTRKELREAWAEVNADEEIWVAILTGSGHKAFCAGTDLKNSLPGPDSFAREYLTAGRRLSVIEGMETFKPIIGAINGYALGGGLELALACDLRICTPNAQFGASEVKVASMPAAGATQKLPRAIPHAIAMKMLLTGERITAEQALQYGLVSDLVNAEDLMTTAFRMAETICQNGPLAVRATKMAAVRGQNMPLSEGMQLEAVLWGVLRDTRDRLEGRRAFMEKRKPEYKGE